MNKKESLESFGRLLTIMDELREKCPWDQKQTLKSLRNLTIEEVYELSDAIINDDFQEIKKELGDLFLHLVFYSKIADENNYFDVSQVLNSICDKLIYRHPHIYSDVTVENQEDVKRNWEKLKLKEGRNSVLEGVPKGLPAMIKAYRIQDKVKGVGFEFQNNNQIIDKIREEIEEFNSEQDSQKKEVEFGDLLFSLINYARFNGINPEDALEKSNKKFIDRFQKLEKFAKEDYLELDSLSIEQMEIFWKKAKHTEN